MDMDMDANQCVKSRGKGGGGASYRPWHILHLDSPQPHPSATQRRCMGRDELDGTGNTCNANTYAQE